VDTEVQGASFKKAQLQGTRIIRTNFRGASFGSAKFQGAYLQEVAFQGAYLNQAQFQATILTGVDFRGVSLEDANLSGASLVGVQFSNAMLQRVCVWRASPLMATFAKSLIAKVLLEAADPEAADPVACKLDQNSFKKLRAEFERSMQTGLALGNLTVLDPARPYPNETNAARAWITLELTSPTLATYQINVESVLREIGCAEPDAPYAVVGLLEQMDPASQSQIHRFTKDDPNISKIASDFLKSDCAGARGLPDLARARLIELRDGRKN
jgi:hypothetical protein